MVRWTISSRTSSLPDTSVFFRFLLCRRPSGPVTNDCCVVSDVHGLVFGEIFKPGELGRVGVSSSSSLLHPSHSASLIRLSGSLSSSSWVSSPSPSPAPAPSPSFSSTSFSRHLCNLRGDSYSPVLGLNFASQAGDMRNPCRPEATHFRSILSRHSGYRWNLVSC